MSLILRIGAEIVLSSLKTDLTEQLKVFLTYFLSCVCLVRCVQSLSTVTWQLQQHAPCTRHAAKSQCSIPPVGESVGLRTLCPCVRRVPLPDLRLESAIQVPSKHGHTWASHHRSLSRCQLVCTLLPFAIHRLLSPQNSISCGSYTQA